MEYCKKVQLIPTQLTENEDTKKENCDIKIDVDKTYISNIIKEILENKYYKRKCKRPTKNKSNKRRSKTIEENIKPKLKWEYV